MVGERMVSMVKGLVAVPPSASVRVTLNDRTPSWIEVPLITPVAMFRASPEGGVPLVTTNWNGGTPPTAERAAAEVRPREASGGAPLRATGGRTVSWKDLEAACGVAALESVAVRVKVAGPAAVGAPEIAPVAAFSASPSGSEPL